MIPGARAVGLDCGPVSGFDNAKVDDEFFATGRFESAAEEFSPEGHVKSTFLCNIGYGDPATLVPRGARLDFSEACPCCDCRLLALQGSAAAPPRRQLAFAPL